MSLIKKRQLTQKGVAASRQNGRRSKGPATEQGRQQIREANLKHGFYSPADEAALAALGEDPEDFRRLVAGLEEKGTALRTLQRRLAKPLARALVRMDRADRMQEGQTLRRARAEDSGRLNRLHAEIMATRLVEDNLRALLLDVQEPYFVALPAHLKQIQNLNKEVVLKEMHHILVALFYCLREPGTPGLGEPGAGEDPLERQRQTLTKMQMLFGLSPSALQNATGSAGESVAPATESVVRGTPSSEAATLNAAGPVPQEPASEGQKSEAPAPEPPGNSESAAPSGPPERFSHFPAGEWEARMPVCEILAHLLAREVELCVARREELLREVVKGPSLHERAAEIATAVENNQHLERFEDSNFRRAARLSNLLIRIRRLEERLEDREIFHNPRSNRKEERFE